MQIITGFTGTKHITSEMDRDIHIGLCGPQSYVLSTGRKIEAEVASNNEIKINDGVIMHQGCAGSIKKNTYDSVTIMNGSQGMKRIDLIVCRHTKDSDSSIEKLELLAIQGTPAESDPAVPEYTEGDIQAGDSVADMPLYEVELDGINVVEVRPVFQLLMDMSTINASLSYLIGKTEDSGWVNITLGYGMSVATGRTPQVRKIGNIVYMRGRVTTSTQWEQHDSIVSIPDGFRPSQDEVFIQSSTGTYRYRLEIKQAGNVVANAITNNTNGNAEAVSGQWFALNSSWLVS